MKLQASLNCINKNTLQEPSMLTIPYLFLYKAAIVIFFLSIPWDTGGHEIYGVPIPMIALLLPTIIGLYHWYPPRDKIILGAVLLILIWILSQLLLGNSLVAIMSMVLLLTAGLVFGGQGNHPSLVMFQIRAIFCVLLATALTYYLGLWRPVPTGNTLSGFDPNAIAFLLIVGSVLAIALFQNDIGAWKWSGLLTIPIFLIPVWFTGSRKGVFFALTSLTIYFFFVTKWRKTLLLILFGIVLVITPAFKHYYFSTTTEQLRIVPEFFRKSDIFKRRYTYKLYGSTNFRAQLIQRGMEVYQGKPWIGYGIGKPSTTSWLKENIGIQANDGTYVMVHNGFIDYLLMGGMPLFMMFTILHGRVTWLLWKLSFSEDMEVRKLAHVFFTLNVLFLSNVFFGDYSWKLGWWILGCGLLVIRLADIQLSYFKRINPASTS